MAQKSQPTKIVKAPANALTDKALLEEMERDAGKGQAKHAEDKILPFMRVLQPLSPQCIKKGPAYISGAEPGDFFLSSSAAPIISGTDGLIFQPCFYRRDWIEWVPREDGGGFAGRYEYNYSDIERKGLPADATRNENGFTWSRPNGHDLVDTIYFVGNVWREGRPEAFVVPFAGTAHKIGRNWNNQLQSRQLPSGKPFGLFAFKSHWTTSMTTNEKGSWWLIRMVDEGMYTPRDPEYVAGRNLFNACETDQRTIQETQRESAADSENM